MSRASIMSNGKYPTLLSAVAALWGHIEYRRRRQLKLLLVVMVIATFAEVFSIGAVIPFLGVLTAPDQVFANSSLRPFFQMFGLMSDDQLLLPFTVLFCCSAIAAGGMRLFMLWASTRLAAVIGSDLSIAIYRRTLYQPYSIHVARNSSEVIAGISTKVSDVIHGVIYPMLVLASSVTMLLAIFVALIAISSKIALLAFAGFGGIYLVVVRLTKRSLAMNSRAIARESVEVVKALQEGLGGIRDVLLDGAQELYSSAYRSADVPLRQAQASNQFLSAFPRYGIEALGMLLIAGLAYLMASSPSGIASAIPVLGSLALGAQRLLPMLQQAYSSWTSLRSAYASLSDTLTLLDQPMSGHFRNLHITPILFSKELVLRDVSFRYNRTSPLVLNNISLNICKGSRVGFIGTTGSGKSTLFDLVMGLLSPASGALMIDGVVLNESNIRGWQRQIAHVPQSIFLADATVAENIALGIVFDEIDWVRLRWAASQAQIDEVISSWREGYMTHVGERGVRLSGGQRQRIGIARALYKKANIIIFDEATSALDNGTESLVMRALESLSHDVTILMIAHRLSTLSQCTQVVELINGSIARVGSYRDIVVDESRFGVTTH